jgi:flagellar biosynthesis protein FliQ
VVVCRLVIRALLAGLVVALIQSLPDIARYMKIRSM